MAPTLQKHTLTAFYESRDYADSAATKLRQAGVPSSDVVVSPDDAGDGYRDGYGATATAPKKTGFWASLEEMFGGTDDHHTYAEGLRRGHTLLTAHVTDAQLDSAIAIVEEHGSIDLDEHEETWRSEGWTANSASGIGTGAVAGGAMGLAMAGATAPARIVETETVVTRPAVVAPTPVTKAPMPVLPKPTVAPAVAVGRGAEDVLQVVEERLVVGKRAVSRGKVRLHSYVVENQVSEDVTLRDETVTVDRHAVDRPVAALGAEAFQERTIEMEEIDEEAVVGKTARVVEEIGIRKAVSDRVETIRDTVRSTKVEIEDGRTVGMAGDAVGRFAAEIRGDMEVVGSDGLHVGTVDHLDGGRIKLKKADVASGGEHHFLTQDMVRSVGVEVVLAVTAAEAKARWATA